MLVNCGWNLVMWLLYMVYGLYVMHLSHSIVHDLVFALALWSVYPLVYKLYNQNPKKPILLNYVLWDCVGLLFCILRTISGTNNHHAMESIHREGKGGMGALWSWRGYMRARGCHAIGTSIFVQFCGALRRCQCGILFNFVKH